MFQGGEVEGAFKKPKEEEENIYSPSINKPIKKDRYLGQGQGTMTKKRKT